MRLPVVPVSAVSDPPFSVLHPDDAARAMVAAIEHRLDGPCNIVGDGAATPWQAARLGGRVPLPVLPGLVGSGRARVGGDGRRARPRTSSISSATVAPATGAGRATSSGSRDLTPTQDVLRELFDWADVVAIARAGEQAA